MAAQLQLRERATLLGDLRQIVQAMKNLAMAELQRLRRSQPALAEAQTTLEAAWAQLAEPAARSPHGVSGDRIWLVIGAERGFCGAFNAHLVDAASTLLARPDQTLWLAGQRLADTWQASRPAGAGEVRSPPRVLPGCGALDEAEPVLAAWLQAATEAVAGLHVTDTRRSVWLLSTGPQGLRAQRLLPSPGAPQAWPGDLEAARALPPPAQAATAPLRLGLPRPVLMAAVLHQTVRVQLRAALETSLVQENHARLAQMQRAQDHLDELAADLRRRWARLRQSDITNELELLTAALGPDAAAGGH